MLRGEGLSMRIIARFYAAFWELVLIVGYKMTEAAANRLSEARKNICE